MRGFDGRDRQPLELEPFVLNCKLNKMHIEQNKTILNWEQIIDDDDNFLFVCCCCGCECI